MAFRKVKVEISENELLITGLTNEQVNKLVEGTIWYCRCDGVLLIDDTVDVLYNVMHKLSCICDYTVKKGKE